LGAGATSVGEILANGVSAADIADIVTMGAGATAPNLLPAEMSGSVLEPGTYTTTTAVSLTGTLYLLLPNSVIDVDGNYNDAAFIDSAPDWLFTIGGAFGAAAASQVIFLIEGSTVDVNRQMHTDPSAALKAKVSWMVTGAVTIGAGSNSIGAITSKAAITVGAQSTTGLLHSSTNAAITRGAGSDEYSPHTAVSVAPENETQTEEIARLASDIVALQTKVAHMKAFMVQIVNAGGAGILKADE
jgi:hypothetical protein